MRAAFTTFHKVQYQHAIAVCTTTAPPTRTRDLATPVAAATTTTTTSTPVTSSRPETADNRQASARRRQQQQQQQQTTNKTWPPGTSSSISCRRATTAAESTFAEGPVSNINTSRQQVRTNRNQRISEPINLFSTSSRDKSGADHYDENAPSSSTEVLPPPPLSLHEEATSITNHQPGRANHVPSVRLAYKRVECSRLEPQSVDRVVCEPKQQLRLQPQTNIEQERPVVKSELSSLLLVATANQTLPLCQIQSIVAKLEPQSENNRQQESTQCQHEYQEVSPEELEEDKGDQKLIKRELQTFLLTKSNGSQENPTTVQQRKQKHRLKLTLNNHQLLLDLNKRSKPKHLAMATLRPISPQYQHTLDSAISLSKELASKNMADSGESSPKTPNSPDKKRFNFKLKHFSKSYSEASANIRDIESSISDEAKQAYKSLVERGQFVNSSHQPFNGGRTFSYRGSPSARDYANEDFHTPTTPPANSNKFKYSTFSVKKPFF